MTSEAYVQLPLSQMVDLCINSPESGVVNFGLLHTALQVIVQKINAQECCIELHGNEAAKITNFLKGEKPNPSIKIKEVQVETKSSVNASTQPETVMVVMPTSNDQEIIMPVTKQQIDLLTEEVEFLKQQFEDLSSIPANARIIDQSRNDTSGGGSSPVVDVFHFLTLTKRIEAAEVGMEKLSSIVEDVIRNPMQHPRVQFCRKSRSKSKSELSKSEVASKSVGGLSEEKSVQKSEHETDSEFRSRLTDMPADDALQEIIEEVARLRKAVDETLLGLAPTDVGEGTSTVDASGKVKPGPREQRLSIPQMMQDMQEIKDVLFKRRRSSGTATEAGEDNEDEKFLPPDLQLALMEDRFKEYTEHLEQLDMTFNDELAKLHNQFTDIEKDFNEILSKMQAGLPAGDKSLDEPNQCCALVYQKLVQLQTDFEQLTDTSVKLLEDKDEKQKQMDEMLEAIELIKTIKADREDIEEALADKADACAVHRKVSHDQFDSACDELSKGIEEALEKLAQQEHLWQQALEDIQNEIGNKLDKMDLGPLREFINNKLRMLQDKMKSLAALKREQEAAGTKSKLLRDVQCISCDKDVVMRKEMDTILRPPHASVPPTRSMAPYLAYELDALRKQQKSLPGSKNLNNFENAVGLAKLGKKGEDHICNRYCGGSHTITTPQQRVTRLGHFLMQWGPEAITQDTRPEIADEKKSSQIHTKQSIIVHGDITSSRRSGEIVVTTDKSKSGMMKAQSAVKTSGSKGSVGRDVKRQSQGSAKGSMHMQEKRVKSGSIGKDKSILKSPAETQPALAEDKIAEEAAEAAEVIENEGEQEKPGPNEDDVHEEDRQPDGDPAAGDN